MYSQALQDELAELSIDYTFSSAVVLLSGGQDSVTCLHYALKRHGAHRVRAIGFNYGQRHRTELDQAAKVAGKHGVPYTVIDVAGLKQVGRSALTGEGDVSQPHPDMADVPASFVPARNAVFLTLAFAYAQSVGAAYVYGGMCQTDYSGYPDCRDNFVKLLNRALVEGYPSEPFPMFITPLMFLTKAETFALADAAGGLDDVIKLSHTCYEGDRTTRHPWGYGCGTCPACKLRAKGWDEYQLHFVGSN
jgi:7-cyano-7-deazaguanine synthase